jgi:hypothetical protein
MNFIQFETAQKLRGGFYTDADIAAFLTRWVAVVRPRRVFSLDRLLSYPDARPKNAKKQAKAAQHFALDGVLPFCNDVGRMNVSEKQFSLTREASKTGAAAKKQIPTSRFGLAFRLIQKTRRRTGQEKTISKTNSERKQSVYEKSNEIVRNRGTGNPPPRARPWPSASRVHSGPFAFGPWPSATRPHNGPFAIERDSHHSRRGRRRRAGRYGGGPPRDLLH